MTVSIKQWRAGETGALGSTFFCLAVGVVFLLAGCVTTPQEMASPVGTNQDPDGASLNNSAAQSSLIVAQRMIRAGEYSLAIPRLMNIVSKHPKTTAGMEARYFLGLTYYHLGGYRDALDNFSDYLEMAPDGKYTDVTREYVAKLADETSSRYQTMQQLENRIVEVSAQARLEPEVLAHQLELADLYWKTGQYDDASGIYLKVLAQWPQLETDSTIRRRMERGPDGKYTVLTPVEVERRYAEAEPLVVFNTHSFRSGSGEGSSSYLSRRTVRYRTSDQYHVTGQVLNRSNETLNDVQVMVTIYGFGAMIYDTQTFKIGRMRSGDKRAFSVRFNNFDYIENITRYECVATFQR